MQDQLRERFETLVKDVCAALQGDEKALFYLVGEVSDFVRFNRGKIRQATAVLQAHVTFTLVSDGRQAVHRFALGAEGGDNKARGLAALEDLRPLVQSLPADPHLHFADSVDGIDRVLAGELPSGPEAAAAVVDAAGDLDLVGIYAGGDVVRGFANSWGGRHWFSVGSYHLDWSVVHAGDKASKARMGGRQWDGAGLQRTLGQQAEHVRVLARPPRTVKPGRYRVYLAPAALQEVFSLLAWDSFGLKSHRTKQTGLLRMVTGDAPARLHDQVHLDEHTAESLAPPFDAAGFAKPDRVSLVRAGEYGDCLVSARSAKEYGLPCSGASGGEEPEALEMAAGSLPSEGMLERLGTGVWVSDLWYMNYSDRPACRMTGMTRFATFWVEDGVIQAPLSVMRFDESVYRMLGSQLEGLTQEREWLLDPNTYEQRSSGSMRLPGALVNDFTLTL